jgi:hypothetical protein
VGAFTVRFDIRTEVSWLAPTVMLLVWLFFALLNVAAVVQMWRRRERGGRLVGVALSLALIVGVGAVTLPRQFYSRWQWVRAAERGDYEVVEGPVTDFDPSRTRPNWSASYKVGGVPFRSSNNPFAGESPRTAEAGGPIREGAYLRIAHKRGRVLRVEARE